MAPVTSQEIAEHAAAMAVYEFMSATKALSDLAASKTNAPLVQREANDIEIAYVRLGRMLSQLRSEQSRAA